MCDYVFSFSSSYHLYIQLFSHFLSLSQMIFSDYCMDPNGNAAKLVNPSSSAFASSQFFLTCQGTDPLESPLRNLSTSIEYFSHQVANITATKSCGNTAALNNMQFQINSMQASYSYIVNNTQCSQIQSSFDTFAETNLCGDTFLGFYIIWLSQYLTAGCLFLMTVVASIIYQLFGRYWDETETDILVKTLQSSAFEKPKYNPEEHYDDLSTNERKSRKERAEMQLSTDTYDSNLTYGVDEYYDGFGGSPGSGNHYNSNNPRMY